MKFGLKEKLFGGFSIVLLLFVITIIVSLKSVWTLKNNVELTHDHPLIVTRAVLKIEVLTISMHHSMKDVVLSMNKNERDHYILVVEENEKEALAYFDIVQDKILGKEGQRMAARAKDKFWGWRVIRNRVVDLMDNAKVETARVITQNGGNYYVQTITSQLKELENYAGNKADEFNHNSMLIAKNTRSITIIVFLSSVLISVFVVVISLRYLSKRLALLQGAAIMLSKGEFDELTKPWNAKEIDHFVEGFKEISMHLKRSQDSLEEKIKERTKELEEANEQLITLKENLELKVEERTRDLANQVNKLDKSQQAMLFLVEDLNDTSKKLKEKQEKLNNVNQELEAFTYSVSHDLRAPLRAIEGFSKFLLSDYSEKLDEEGKRFISVIRDNTKKMDQLITDLLRLSRVTKSEMTFTKIGMAQLAAATYNEIATEEEKQAFEFIVEDIPDAKGDTTLIKQVWSNFIGNSLKYSAKSEHKKINIGYLNDENSITYFVRDSGAGFNSKYKDKVFGVFQRLHKDNEFKGTGVGLAIVKRILDKHNGKVWAEGAVDKGATFYFSLPK
jgi:signal transduction histidine kinase